MLYQAHRGVQKEFPENTMVSYRAAKAQGYHIIELDPAVTSDGVFLMMHDRTLNRTGRYLDGTPLPEKMAVSDTPYSEICRMEFGSWFHESFRGEKAPLVKDVLRFAAEEGIRLKIDNKFEEFHGETMEAFLQLFDAYDCSNITFSLRDRDLCRELCRRFPLCTIGFDGITKEEDLVELKAITQGHELQIWNPLASPLTTWWKGEFLSPENAALVKKYAHLCAWILDSQEDYEMVKKVYDPYAIETTGVIKPE